MAHHGNDAHRSLRDVLAFDEAVGVAMNETDEDDTLIVVSADHSHPLIIGGYSKLDNDILGKASIILVVKNENRDGCHMWIMKFSLFPEHLIAPVH